MSERGSSTSENAVRAKFGEHVACELLRIYHGQSLGPTELHSRVTILGQQGSES
jgi:hypothetical protein